MCRACLHTLATNKCKPLGYNTDDLLYVLEHMVHALLRGSVTFAPHGSACEMARNVRLREALCVLHRESRGMASHEINTHTYTSTRATTQQDLLLRFVTYAQGLRWYPSLQPRCLFGGGRGLVVSSSWAEQDKVACPPSAAQLSQIRVAQWGCINTRHAQAAHAQAEHALSMPK